MRIDKIYHSELRLAQAKELYPEWYQQRVVEKQPRGTWKRQAGIYFNWIDKVIAGGRVGHRYHCLENLCALAVQCDIPPEILEADVRELAEYLETLTDDEKNHFTEHDIQCALKTYYDARKGEAREDRKKGIEDFQKRVEKSEEAQAFLKEGDEVLISGMEHHSNPGQSETDGGRTYTSKWQDLTSRSWTKPTEGTGEKGTEERARRMLSRNGSGRTPEEGKRIA